MTLIERLRQTGMTATDLELEAADELERMEHEVAQMTTARSVMEAELEQLRILLKLHEANT